MHSLVGRPGTTTAGFPRPHPLCGLATCCTHWEIGIRHPETRTVCLFFVWQIHNTFKRRKELPCSFDKIRLNGHSDYTYNLIIPWLQGLHCCSCHGHMYMGSCMRNKGARLTIWLSGAQLTRVPPAFSLQSTAAFLLGMVPGFGRWTLPTFKLGITVAHSQICNTHPQDSSALSLLKLGHMIAGQCLSH